tara:strand:+ start:2797 stop:2940 length:144 start_codon:yes stop_codon:yes gene_type:complete
MPEKESGIADIASIHSNKTKSDRNVVVFRRLLHVNAQPVSTDVPGSL